MTEKCVAKYISFTIYLIERLPKGEALFNFVQDSQNDMEYRRIFSRLNLWDQKILIQINMFLHQKFPLDEYNARLKPRLYSIYPNIYSF